MSTKLKARDQRYSAGQIDRWRAKLAVGDAISSLNETARGQIECSTARIKAIEIILRKTLPDLASVELHTGAEGLTFTWGMPTIEGTVINQETNAATQQTPVNALSKAITDKPMKDSGDKHKETADITDKDGIKAEGGAIPVHNKPSNG